MFLIKVDRQRKRALAELKERDAERWAKITQEATKKAEEKAQKIAEGTYKPTERQIRMAKQRKKRGLRGNNSWNEKVAVVR